MPRNIVKVYFNNGCSSLAYDESTTIQVGFSRILKLNFFLISFVLNCKDLIKVLIKGKLCQNELRYKKCYMIRGAKYENELTISEIIWFKNTDHVEQIINRIFSSHDEKWK
jgi:hypothetical protein